MTPPAPRTSLPRCRICGTPIGATRRLGLCCRHLAQRQYERRKAARYAEIVEGKKA